MKIRKLQAEENELLKDFLYEAIFIPQGMKVPEKSIIENEKLKVYYEDFGSGKDDHCLAAEDKGIVIGAVWVRIMNDYGHVDDQTPSLAISLYPEERNKGYGSRLLEEMLKLLKDEGYQKVSLSVQKENYAYKMYKKAGFKIIEENDQEYIMIRELNAELMIRELDPSYIEEIKPLFRKVFEVAPWNEVWDDDRQLDEYLKDLIEVRNPLIYGLYEKEKLLGVSIGRIKHWYAGTEYYIEELFIANDFQHHGYGKRFMELIENDLKEKDIHEIYLVTDRDKPAYDFYRKTGFKELPELTSFFKEF